MFIFHTGLLEVGSNNFPFLTTMLNEVFRKVRLFSNLRSSIRKCVFGRCLNEQEEKLNLQTINLGLRLLSMERKLPAS